MECFQDKPIQPRSTAVMSPLTENGPFIEKQAIEVAIPGSRTIEILTGIRPNLIHSHHLAIRQGLREVRASQPSLDLVLCLVKSHRLLEVNHLLCGK